MTEREMSRGPEAFQRASWRLASALEQMADEAARDRGKLAALRKGLGEPDGWHPAVAMVVDPVIGGYELYPEQENALYLAASLFSLHPQVRSRAAGERSYTLMDALNTLVRQRVEEGEGALDDMRASLDRRVIALLNADREDLPNHLRYTISLLRGTEIPVDWAQLMRDINDWTAPDRRVQRAWARAWWRAPAWVRESAAVPDGEVDAVAP